MRAAAAVGLALALGLAGACSGGGDPAPAAAPAADAAPRLDSAGFEAAYCSRPEVFVTSEGLLAWDGPTTLPELSVSAVLKPDETVLDGVLVRDAQALGDMLREKADQARAIAEMAPKYRFEGRMMWSIQPDVPASRVAEAAAVADAAGFHTMQWLVRIPGAAEPPPFVVPELAESVFAELETRAPGELQTRLAERTSSEVDGCEVAVHAFTAVAVAAPEAKCSLLAASIDSIWKECPKQAPRIVTMLQIPMFPGPPVGAIVTTWTADADPIEVAPETPWKDLLPVIAADADQMFRLSVPQTPPGG